MQEVVIISGKGGTGKTSLAAAFAALADGAVLADCDVDAADLHLVLAPRIERRAVFRSGYEARVAVEHCTGCGICAQLCRFEAIRRLDSADGGVVYAVDPHACEGCGVCVRHCPADAIDFEQRECGEWFISQTRFGPMVHAALRPAAENSGKLVNLVREQAREAAQAAGRELVLIDGSPGIGCPVIASITGVSLAVVVSEPTVSGLHDLQRIAQVTSHFRVPTVVCVNKWDLNADMTKRIEDYAREQGLGLAGRMRYDRNVTQAQIAGRSIVEWGVQDAAEDARMLWRAVEQYLSVSSAVKHDALPREIAQENPA